MKQRQRLFALFPVLAVAGSTFGCESAPEEETAGSSLAATSCQPALDRYPVAGPHNGGWDKEATTFACEGRDNSDYYRGAGGANHASGHLGNDIFGPRGTPIVVAKSGVVVEASNTQVGGLNVVIRDDCGWSYYYAHLDSIDRAVAAVGRRVESGEQIGTLGDTGQAKGTAPHLHFSIYPGNYNAGIDPFPYLDAVASTACGPTFEPTERPTGGPFEALEVKSPIGGGQWLTQCNESADGERVWQTTNGGPNPDARWAEAKYPQDPVGGCGAPSEEGKYPIVFRSLQEGELGGAWIASCSAERDGAQHVFRVVTSVDGHPAAAFQYNEENPACR